MCHTHTQLFFTGGVNIHHLSLFVSVQTALTEVKTKLKLEQRLGDKEKELSAVKQKLQEV